jgi:two-component system, response regulator PdtaR
MNGHSIPRRPVVLLVEDELLVRMATADALEDAGFDVIETANAEAAQGILAHRTDIQVLFTDVKMPGALDGLELADLVRRRWPHILIVVTSGHLNPENGSLPENAVFIPKPYSEKAPGALIQALLS